MLRLSDTALLFASCEDKIGALEYALEVHDMPLTTDLISLGDVELDTLIDTVRSMAALNDLRLTAIKVPGGGYRLRTAFLLSGETADTPVWGYVVTVNRANPLALPPRNNWELLYSLVCTQEGLAATAGLRTSIACHKIKSGTSA